MSDSTIQEIIQFWFSDDVKKYWFNSTQAFDEQLSEKYQALWQDAADGKLDHWQQSADGALALIIILDQFPLNMFRGNGKRYSTEAKSRQVAIQAIDQQFSNSLTKAQLAFAYLPFMHSEDIKDQQYAIELYEAAGLDDNAKYARHHCSVVERFGRFPHRNEELGRSSTHEELEYLKTANW